VNSVYLKDKLAKNLSKLRALSLVFFLCTALIACEEKPISQLTPEEGITRIRESHQESSWDRVVQQVNEYRSRYPYTLFAAEAELLQADSYFQSARYAEAIVVYEEFLKKNPAHKEAPLASFRVAKSYDNQSPEEIDREQAFSEKAIERYNAFLELFAQTKFAPEAKERILTLRRRMADHYAFVARFYWKKELYQGAVHRYLKILEEYPLFDDLKKEAQTRAAEGYRELAKILEKDPASDKVVYFRNSSPADLRKKADELLLKK
jgi:outer membrane protein assembly factor BamD